MKRLLWLTVLALALPLTAFADSVDFTNSGGILAGCSDGLSLTGSALIAVKGLNGLGLVTGSRSGERGLQHRRPERRIAADGRYVCGGGCFHNYR